MRRPSLLVISLSMPNLPKLCIIRNHGDIWMRQRHHSPQTPIVQSRRDRYHLTHRCLQQKLRMLRLGQKNNNKRPQTSQSPRKLSPWMSKRVFLSPNTTHFRKHQLLWHYHQVTSRYPTLSDPQELIHVIPRILSSESYHFLTAANPADRWQSHCLEKASIQSSKTVGITKICLTLHPIATSPVPDYMHSLISPGYIISDSSSLSEGSWFQSRVTSLGTESGPIKFSLIYNLVYPHYSTAIKVTIIITYEKPVKIITEKNGKRSSHPIVGEKDKNSESTPGWIQ